MAISNQILVDAGRRLLRVDKLVARCAKLEATIQPLLRAYKEWDRAVHDRCNVSEHPERLAGLIELYQHGDPTFCERATGQYHVMVRAMIDKRAYGYPRRVDFKALPTDARPYLLAPYIGAEVGEGYPVLCFERSRPMWGELTYVSHSGPIDITRWQRALPTINGWLGDTWVIRNSTVDTLTLVKRAPLPAVVPFSTNLLAPGHLLLGIDVSTQKPALLPFSAMTSGTFIPGASGTGKSNALHVLLQSIFANLDQFAAVYLVDGKDGVAFNRYRDIAPAKVRVLWEEPEVWQLTSELVATMRARNAEQREQNRDNTTSDFIAVVIDEMSTFTAKPSSDSKNPDDKRHAQFVDELAMLARRGRSTGLRLIITAQEPVVEQIPATVRANCLTTLAFKLPIDVHANAVFGQLDGLPYDPRKLPRGQALFKNGLTGEVCHVQVPVWGEP